jgi:uncharacterized RDD family membrane protein YckC
MPAAPAPPPAAQTGLQGRYAGAVSRFTAYAIDVAVSAIIYVLGLAASSYGATIVTGHAVSWNRNSPLVIALFVAWEFAYFAYSWAANGRTPGMALLGLRVVRSSGAGLSGRRAVLRTLAFPLSFLVFGLGFALILVQRDRRALHDLIADTVVVYAWDARAARLRYLTGR